MNSPDRLSVRPTTTVRTQEKVGVSRQISVGLIALSLSLISLALGSAFFSVSGPAAFILVPTVTINTAPSSATAVTLTWTAPGDDDATGQATQYDLRYALSPIDLSSFASATTISDEPVPQPAGSTETYTVTNLTPATTYFFALMTTDEVGNVSGISNIATATTDALPVVCTPAYQCSDWSPCLNQLQTRTCTDTNSCNTGLDQPITSQACTSPVPVPEPPPVVPPVPPDTTPPPTPSPVPLPSGGGPVHVLKHIIASGVGPGTIPVVRIINPMSKKAEHEFVAFRRSNLKGTNVDVGDIDGDHNADVLVGSGVGSDPLVKVYTDRATFVGQFNPYPASRGIGVDVAAGDVNGDGIDEILTVPAKGASHLRIFTFDGVTKQFTPIAQTFVYGRDRVQGFTVAAGDLDLDGRADIVVAPRAEARTVTVLTFDTSQAIKKSLTFSPYAFTFRSGITVAIGDTDGNGRGEILTTPGPGYFSHVKVFDITGRSLRNFLPASTAWLGGVDLTSLDVNTDGRDEVITGSYSNGDPAMRVWRYSGTTKKFSLLQSYFIFPRTMKSGLRLGSQ